MRKRIFTKSACSVPALFIFSMDIDGMLNHEETVCVEGNVLDVVFIKNPEFVLYTMDAVHQSFSTATAGISQRENPRPWVGVLNWTNSGWKKNAGPNGELLANMQVCLEDQPRNLDFGTAKRRSMRELLYNLESLRKKDSEE